MAPTHHRVTATTTIAAPLDHVWALLCATRHYDEWIESTIHVVSAEDAVRLGSIYVERTRLSGFWTATTQWEVVELRPPNHLAFQGSGVAALRELRVEFEVTPAGETCEISSTYSYSLRFGPLGALLEFGFKNNVTAEQRRSLRTFAILAERRWRASR